MNVRSQKGFAHAVLIIGLVIALIGALGFVFWQNFVHKAPAATNTQIMTKKSKKPDTTIKLTESYVMPSENLVFSYPSNWMLTKNYKENSYGTDNTATLKRDNGIKLSFSIPSYGPSWQFGERIFGCPFDDNYDENGKNELSLCPNFEKLYSAKSSHLNDASIYVFSRTYPAGSIAKSGIDLILAKTGCEGTDQALCKRPEAKTGHFIDAGATVDFQEPTKFMKSDEAKEMISILESVTYQ
ncbi:MAG TPA: hypothetical protein PL051_00700 [Candidatus Saccharibacteria bacterium]|nr:hypothetical protein [Candidatus Saccharibacteria bacterium]